MQTNPAAEQNKTLNGPRVRGISPIGKKKVYEGKDLPKSQFLSSEWKTERVRGDESGDSEDGEDGDGGYELPCVIGESESDEASEDHWGVRFTDKMQHTEKRDYWFSQRTEKVDEQEWP